MNNRVYTYTDIMHIKTAPYFSEIITMPQITLSNDMAKFLKKDIRAVKRNVMSFEQLVKELIPGWNTSAQRIRYAAILNGYMRELIQKGDEKPEKDWLIGCKKNIYPAVSNIITLEEAGARPEDITADDKDIRLFVNMWKLLEKEDLKSDINNPSYETIKAFRQRINELKNTNCFENNISKRFNFNSGKEIIFNGFQNFTPMQKFIYDSFINTGYNVHALIQYDHRYPYAGEVWHNLYNKENGYPDIKEWNIQIDDTNINPIGEIFEKGERVKAPNLKLIKYKNVIEFITDIKRIKDEGYYIYCSDDKAANNMLKDFYPEKYEARNLLSYQIGQFIYALHDMWDDNLCGLVLTDDILRKCFTSGWLSAHGKSSMRYTEDLERILPFFEGCITIDSWNERINRLMGIYENIIDMFEDTITPDKEDMMTERFASPLKIFSMFSLKKERLLDVINIIRQLTGMAEKLFGRNEPVSIYEHLSKLDSIIYFNDGMSEELFREEREKVRRIFAALESNKIKDYICYPGDIAAALQSFMRDDYDEENRNQPKSLVFNIFQITVAPLAADGKVHICLADINKMPWNEGIYSWPIDENILKDIKIHNKYTRIDSWINSAHITTLAGRNYIFSALQNPQVEISWVERQGEKILSPSPYITLLERFSDCNIKSEKVRNLNLENVATVMPHNHINVKYSLETNPSIHNNDDRLEYAACPMRYVYSYVLGKGSVFRGEYQQTRAIVRLIQSLYELLDGEYTIEDTAKQVFELFPGIRSAQKRQITDDAVNFGTVQLNEKTTIYKDKEYSNYRYNIIFPDNDVLVRAMGILHESENEEIRNAGIYFDRGSNAHGGVKNCELCPHSYYCRKALFGVDYKEDADV